jgi:type I restriction-modification system DNA methylase subunit/restriction endonuclease S subunit
MATSKLYSCELCKKVFNQKIDFTRHQNKKSPCITLTELQEISQTKQIKMDNKTTLINVFKTCLNILRDNEGLIGEKALRTMSYLLILKLLEPHFGGEINIDDYEYDFSHIEDEMVEKHKNKLLEIVRFSNLSNEKEDNIPVNMKYLWDDILSKHPTTKNIFLKDKGFDIQHKSTYKKLIDKLNSLDLSQCEYDVLGNAYEEVIQDIMTGKVLGQFFTQPLVKKMMVKLINPQIHPDGKIDTCGDPTMGTAGFLITYLQYILQQATAKNITPDWDFIKTEGLYGKELEPDTYQLAVSNMLISSGHMFNNLDRGDSIRVPITRKFDNILANPPFGIVGLKYDDFQSSLKSEYVPIKTDNAVSLFIQAIIYMLKNNGKCAVVLPVGRDLLSKTDTTLVAIREYLMKTCDLKEIIHLPSGIFTYTTIKTCVFYFVKKREGIDVLESKIKSSKNQKKSSGKDYEFSKTHQTTKVKFYDYNPYEDIKNLLVEVPIEKIASNSYSLNYTEYMKDETDEEQYEDSVVVKTLGEICTFLPKSKRNAKYGNKEGLYPFFKSSIKVDSYVDEPDYEEESLIIGDGGEPNINYGIKFSTSDHCYILQNKNKSFLKIKYVYYYLFHNLDIMKELYTGVAIKNISKTNIEGIKIPIPPLERQQEIIKYLDFIYEKANKTSNEKIAELKTLNEFCLNHQKLFGENAVKTLDELCKFLPKSKRNAKYGNKEGLYPFFKSSIKVDSYVDEPDYEEESLIIGDGGEANINYGVKFSTSDHCYILQNKNKSFLNIKYAYYYLYHNLDIMKQLYTGVAIKNISKTNIEGIKIPVPSFERQKEIVDYCDYNDTLIKKLEKEIENNKKQAQQFITTIVKTQLKSVVEEHDDINLVTEEDEQDEEKKELVPVEEEIVTNDEELETESKPKVKKIVKKTDKKVIKKSLIIEEDSQT